MMARTTTPRLFVLVSTALATVACFAPKIEASRSTDKPIVSRPPQCDFSMVSTLADAKYEELGYLRSTGKVVTNRDEFKRTIGDDVCRLGGDTVFLEYDAYGAIEGANVLRKLTADAGEVVAVVDAGPPPPAAPKHEWVAFESKKVGVAFRYPSDLFKLKEKPRTIELDSGFWVDMPHGMSAPGQDTKQYFRAKIDVRAKSATACIKDDAPIVYKAAFKNGELVEGQGVEKRTVGEKPAYVVLGGAHGYNYRKYYVAFTDKKTAVLQLDVVGDVVQTEKKGATETEQNAIGDEIAQSLSLPAPAAPAKK